jgi:hypothetical protein
MVRTLAFAFKNRSTLVLVALVLIYTKAQANETKYQLNCDGKGNLIRFSVKTPEPCGLMRSAATLACGDTRGAGADASTMAVRSATDGFYSNRNSNKYDREFIREAIASSLKFGVDPHLTLATLLVERPPHDYAPASTVMPWKMYYEDYGIPPIDAVGVTSVFRCSHTSTKGAVDAKGVRHTHYVLSQPPGGRPSFDLRSEGIAGSEGRKVVLALLPFRSGQPPRFEIQPDLRSAQDCKAKCCADVTVPMDWPAPRTYVGQPTGPDDPQARFDSELGRSVATTQRLHAESQIHRELVQRLGNQFKLDIWGRSRRSPLLSSAKDPYSRLALNAQAYNGYGKMGVSEAANSCIKGLHGATQPIYGAGVMDLTLNAMMTNSEIQEMIERAKKELRIESTPSVICKELGVGEHKIDPTVFTQLQRRYLAGRSQCPSLSYGLVRGSARSTPRAPTAPAVDR